MITAKLSVVFFAHFTAVSCHQSESIPEECPLWYRASKDGNCTCEDSLYNIVDCHETKDNILYLRDCFCMTLDSSQCEPVVGSCIYTCYHLFKNSSNQVYMTKIESKSLSDVSNETCGQFNRQGVLCSKCMEGYGLPFSSYNISCVPWQLLLIFCHSFFFAFTHVGASRSFWATPDSIQEFFTLSWMPLVVVISSDLTAYSPSLLYTSWQILAVFSCTFF